MKRKYKMIYEETWRYTCDDWCPNYQDDKIKISLIYQPRRKTSPFRERLFTCSKTVLFLQTNKAIITKFTKSSAKDYTKFAQSPYMSVKSEHYN